MDGSGPYLLSWSSVTWACQYGIKNACKKKGLTICSLQMGHTRRLEALAAAWSLGPSRTLLLMSSRVSAVLAGLLDVCELSERELSDGDSRLGWWRWWAGGWGEMAGDTAGDRFLPLPSTRPPPRDLREAMRASVEELSRESWVAMLRRRARWWLQP